jgi:hypothetical protein
VSHLRPAALLLGLLLGLSGCAAATVGPTPYQAAPAKGGSGYSEVWRSDTVAEVRFAGNWQTDRQKVEDALLYRAAELAEQRDAPRFAVRDKLIERNSYETLDTPPFPSWWYNRSYDWPGYRYGYYGAFPPRVRTWTTYTGSLEMELVPEGAAPPEDAVLHETAAELTRLRPKVLPPPAGES